VTQLTDPARRMPPENCQHCARVRVWITDVTRWHCSRELHMQDKCNDFNPLPNGRRAEPANSIELPNAAPSGPEKTIRPRKLRG